MDVSEFSVLAPPSGRRKPLKINHSMVKPLANVEPLAIESLTLKASNTCTVHFKRLMYQGCPEIHRRDGSIQGIRVDREDFVRDMYNLFKPLFNKTWERTYFQLCGYVAWLDDNNYSPINSNYFHKDLVKLYMEYWADLVRRGVYKRSSWQGSRKALSAILRAQDRHQEAKLLPSLKGVINDTESHKGIDIDTQLKPTARALFRAYYAFKQHVKEGTKPTVNPLWDEELFDKHIASIGCNARQRAVHFRSFKTSVSTSKYWENHISRIAAMLCFMFTGMNFSPLLNMRRGDVHFKQIQGGKYILDADKERAGYLELDNALGFSAHAKRFFESWLEFSTKLSGGGSDAPLFPYIDSNDRVITFIASGINPQEAINKLLARLGLVQINASILRQTKSDTLLKVTEDIYLVSISLNNGIETVRKSYSSGLTQDHVRNLGASMDAKYNIAKGELIDTAVTNAKYTFHDVLSEYDYKKLRDKETRKHEAITPLGVRCTNNTGGATSIIDKALKKSGIDMPQEEIICTDFLGCFECDNHKLVAATDDIWLMLSFRDTLSEMKQYPNINSLPKSRYDKLCSTIDSILSRFNEVSESNYQEALELHKSSSHPLYSTLYSLNDLMETFSWS